VNPISMDNICINISCYVHSNIIYEQNNSFSDQEGFIVGDMQQTHSAHITDQEHQTSESLNTINIYSIVPCKEVGMLGDGLRKLNETKLKEIIGDRTNIIGWYTCRRNTPPIPALRESCFHCQLDNYFKKEFFIYGLFTPERNNEDSTYDFSYTFSYLKNKKWYPVGVVKNNLGSSDTPLSTYRLNPDPTVLQIQDILTDPSDRLQSCLGQEMTADLKKHVESLLAQYTAADAEKRQLLRECEQLRRKITSQRPATRKVEPPQTVGTVDETSSSGDETNDEQSDGQPSGGGGEQENVQVCGVQGAPQGMADDSEEY